MPDSAAALAMADAVALAISRATTPLLERQAALLERCTQLEAKLAILDPLRERVAVVEARPAVPGPQGPAGPPGVDGFTVDELAVEQDAADPRLITLAYRRGEVRKTLGLIVLPTTMYCGVFNADRKGGYVRGDEVTYAGSLWHCNTGTTSRPGTSDVWTLAVKRGDAR